MNLGKLKYSLTSMILICRFLFCLFVSRVVSSAQRIYRDLRRSPPSPQGYEPTIWIGGLRMGNPKILIYSSYFRNDRVCRCKVGFEKNGMDRQTYRQTDMYTNFVKLSYGFAKSHEGHMQLPLAKIYIRHNNQHWSKVHQQLHCHVVDARSVVTFFRDR